MLKTYFKEEDITYKLEDDTFSFTRDLRGNSYLNLKGSLAIQEIRNILNSSDAYFIEKYGIDSIPHFHKYEQFLYRINFAKKYKFSFQYYDKSQELSVLKHEKFDLWVILRSSTDFSIPFEGKLFDIKSDFYDLYSREYILTGDKIGFQWNSPSHLATFVTAKLRSCHENLILAQEKHLQEKELERAKIQEDLLGLRLDLGNLMEYYAKRSGELI